VSPRPFLALFAAALSTQAAAQLPVDRNAMTLGLGAGAIPSYEGSNNYRFIPAPVVRGRVEGFGFNTVGTHLYVDLVRDLQGRIDVQAGPVIGVNPNRAGGIGDRRVRALGELDLAFEAGGYIGVVKTGLATPFDSLAFNVSYQRDLTDTHDSFIVRPQLAYVRPLDFKTAVRISVDAEIVGGGYARTYFGVTPEGAAASGLAAYRLSGGWKDIGVTLGASRSLSGTLLKGWSVFGLAGYNRALGDFADSPVVRDAGDANTFIGSVGIAYSF
jgi:MipA family protein